MNIVAITTDGGLLFLDETPAGRYEVTVTRSVTIKECIVDHQNGWQIVKLASPVTLASGDSVSITFDIKFPL